MMWKSVQILQIDRATMTNGATVVKRGTKLDNLIQIAHNVVIGEDCCIAAQTGIAGSAELQGSCDNGWSLRSRWAYHDWGR